MKTELTKEEEALKLIVRDEWINLALKENLKGINEEIFTKGINWLYTKYLSLPNPQIVYCDGLLSALIKITLVKDYDKEIEDYNPQMLQDFYDNKLDKKFIENIKENYNLKSTYCGWSNFGWVSFYDYFTRIGIIDNDDFNKYKDIIQSNVFECFEFENVVFAIQPPSVIIKNDNDQLHNTSGPALEFLDGTKFYFINGREFDSELITQGFTKERFLKEENEDVRGAMFEIIEAKGEGSMMKFLEAYEYGQDVITHQNGEEEVLTLYRTRESFPELQDINGKFDVPLCWLRLVCPSTGQNYLISTDSSFKTPKDAVKYHRPVEVPFELMYSWDSRN